MSKMPPSKKRNPGATSSGNSVTIGDNTGKKITEFTNEQAQLIITGFMRGYDVEQFDGKSPDQKSEWIRTEVQNIDGARIAANTVAREKNLKLGDPVSLVRAVDGLIKADSEMRNVIGQVNNAIVDTAHMIPMDPTSDVFIQALGHIIHSRMQKECNNSRRCDPFPKGTSLSEMIDKAVKLIPTSGDVVPVDVRDSDLGRVHVPTALPIDMLPMVAAMRMRRKKRQLEISSAI